MLLRLNWWTVGRITALASVVGFLLACSRLDSAGGEHIRSGANKLVLSQNAETLGFEATKDWTSSSGVMSLSSQHTQGTAALAIASPVNYTTITSVKLDSAGNELSGIDFGTSFLVDLLLPTLQPNPYWFGATQMFISAPSRGVYNQYLGQIELTGSALGVFQTREFKIPDFVAQSLKGQRYTDLTLTIVLNVPSSGTGTYVLDNLRVKALAGSPLNVHPTLTCVAQTGAGQFQALFGYANDSNVLVDIAVGPDNHFTPGPVGRGQPEEFDSGTVANAFALAFDGSEVVWTLPGGSASASAQSPACPTPGCSPTCPRGAPCVGGRCVTLCGDGLCGGDESCQSCPADCGCPSGQVCFDKYCATPATCGIDWECGAGASFGVSVDCGACSAGRTCVAHRCQ